MLITTYLKAGLITVLLNANELLLPSCTEFLKPFAFPSL